MVKMLKKFCHVKFHVSKTYFTNMCTVTINHPTDELIKISFIR